MSLEDVKVARWALVSGLLLARGSCVLGVEARHHRVTDALLRVVDHLVDAWQRQLLELLGKLSLLLLLSRHEGDVGVGRILLLDARMLQQLVHELTRLHFNYILLL